MYLDRTLRFACSKVARDSLHGRHDGLMQPRSTSLRLLLTECRSPSNDSCLATEIAQTSQKQPCVWHSFRYDKRGDRSSKLSMAVDLVRRVSGSISQRRSEDLVHCTLQLGLESGLQPSGTVNHITIGDSPCHSKLGGSWSIAAIDSNESEIARLTRDTNLELMVGGTSAARFETSLSQRDWT